MITGDTVPGVKGINIDEIWRAIRKFANEDASKVARALRMEPMNFGELQNNTKLTPNELNHALHDMKTMGLIIQKKDKSYCLTTYSNVLINALQDLQAKLENENSKDLFR